MKKISIKKVGFFKNPLFLIIGILLIIVILLLINNFMHSKKTFIEKYYAKKTKSKKTESKKAASEPEVDNCTAGDPDNKIPPSDKWTNCNNALVAVKDIGADIKPFWNEGNVCDKCPKVRQFETLRCNNGSLSDGKPTKNYIQCNKATNCIQTDNCEYGYNESWWNEGEGCYQCVMSYDDTLENAITGKISTKF
jgi:hypothetical protein